MTLATQRKAHEGYLEKKSWKAFILRPTPCPLEIHLNVPIGPTALPQNSYYSDSVAHPDFSTWAEIFTYTQTHKYTQRQLKKTINKEGWCSEQTLSQLCPHHSRALQDSTGTCGDTGSIGSKKLTGSPLDGVAESHSHHAPSPASSLCQPRSLQVRTLLSSQGSKHPPQTQIHLGTYLLDVPTVSGRKVSRIMWKEYLPGALGASLLLFPKVTLLPSNPLGLPSSDYLVQQVPPSGTGGQWVSAPTVQSERPALNPALLPKLCHLRQVSHLSEPQHPSLQNGGRGLQ